MAAVIGWLVIIGIAAILILPSLWLLVTAGVGSMVGLWVLWWFIAAIEDALARRR